MPHPLTLPPSLLRCQLVSEVNSSLRSSLAVPEKTAALSPPVHFLCFKPQHLPPSNPARLLRVYLFMVHLPYWSGTAMKGQIPESDRSPHFADWELWYAPQRGRALPMSQASRWQRPHGHFLSGSCLSLSRQNPSGFSLALPGWEPGHLQEVSPRPGDTTFLGDLLLRAQEGQQG